jgi:hypothetical protein
MAEANESVQKVEPPKYKVVITMVGVAPTDLEVSKYMNQLSAYSLIRDVALDVSEEKNIDNRMLRQFKITMSLDPAADVRGIDPLIMPRVRNPMTDQMQYGNSGAAVSGSVTPKVPTAPEAGKTKTTHTTTGGSKEGR